MVLRLDAPGESAGQKEFGLQVQRQQGLLREIAGEGAYFSCAGQFLLPPMESFDFGSLPSLTIWKVDIKPYLVWLRAIWNYITQRRLMVSAGELSGRVLIRASIESGWQTLLEWNDEAETHEDAAWKLVTWVAGYEATRR